MTNFVKTANAINTTTNNEYKLDIKRIIQEFQQKKFEKKEVVDAVKADNQIKAYWVIGWESDVTDGLFLGTVMITLKGVPVATLTIMDNMNIISWIDSDLQFEVYDYVESFA